MYRVRFISLLVFALSAAGCAKQLPVETDSRDQMVQATFCASMATKAGETVEADVCVMEIYHNGSLYERVEQPATVPGQFVITVSVLANRDYDVIFWADKQGLYYNRSDLTSISFKSTSISASASSMDAFCQRLMNLHIDPSSAVFSNVTLSRPFAQVDINSTTPVTSVAFSAPASYNLLADTLGANTNYTVSGVNSFHIFAPAQTVTLDLVLNGSVNVTDVMITRNYKTNIHYNN